MKLNPDCIRDILFAVEDLSGVNTLLMSTKLTDTPFLKDKYNYDEVIYHIKQLDMSGYIITPNKNKILDGIYFINDLSPLGHQFIANIRQDTNWNKVKATSKKVGSEALTVLSSIAENVATSAIKSSLGLP